MEENESVQRKHQNRKQRNQKKGECWNDLKKLLTQRSILYYYQNRFFFGRYDRIKDIQEPVEHCKGRDIQWMFFSAQEKPQASTNYVCVLGEAKRYSHSHKMHEGPKRKAGSGSTNENGEGNDLNPRWAR